MIQHIDPTDLKEFVGVVHLYIKEKSHAEAILAAEDIKQHLESEVLDKSMLGEAVDVLEVIPTEEDPIPSASCTTLRRARNVLLRTRTRDGFDLARELDRFAWMLEQKQDTKDLHNNEYDYGQFISTAKQVFDGGNPLG